jgi:hypothetical protein
VSGFDGAAWPEASEMISNKAKNEKPLALPTPSHLNLNSSIAEHRSTLRNAPQEEAEFAELRSFRNPVSGFRFRSPFQLRFGINRAHDIRAIKPPSSLVVRFVFGQAFEKAGLHELSERNDEVAVEKIEVATGIIHRVP